MYVYANDHPIRRRRRRGVALLAAGLALTMGMAACGDSADDEDEDAAPDTTVTTAAPEVEAQAVEVVGVDYGYSQVPASLTAGLVELTFDNQGEVEHEFSLVEIGDTPLEQFLGEFPAVLEGGPFPEYAENVTAPAFAEAGKSVDVTFNVVEGTYALICSLDGDADAPPAEEGQEPEAGVPHFARGMAQVLEVGPGEENVTLPETDGSLTAVDYGFEVDISDGDQTLTFLNEGPEEVHFGSISVFPEGTDEAAAEAAFQAMLQAGEGPPPEGAVMPEDVAFSGIYSTGLGATFESTEAFQSGRTYIVTCFIQDRAGGPPHAVAHEMYEVFTVQ